NRLRDRFERRRDLDSAQPHRALGAQPSREQPAAEAAIEQRDVAANARVLEIERDVGSFAVVARRAEIAMHEAERTLEHGVARAHAPLEVAIDEDEFRAGSEVRKTHGLPESAAPKHELLRPLR